jgi:hypothetical protein
MAVVFRMDNRVGHILAAHSRYVSVLIDPDMRREQQVLGRVQIFSSKHCSQTPSVYVLNVRDKVSHPYRTTGKIIVSYNATVLVPEFSWKYIYIKKVNPSVSEYGTHGPPDGRTDTIS